MRRSSKHTRSRLGALTLLASAAVLVAGCGGSKSPSVASVQTTASNREAASTNPTGDTAGRGAPESPAEMQQGLLRFAECMRAHGVPDFPDPSSGGGFVIGRGSGIDRSSPAFEAARAKCWKLLPGGGPPGPGSTTHPSGPTLAHFVKVAQCMRRQGVADFPDPRTSVPSNFGGRGVISDIDGVILVFRASIDTQSPVFTRAANACGFPLHHH